MESQAHRQLAWDEGGHRIGPGEVSICEIDSTAAWDHTCGASTPRTPAMLRPPLHLMPSRGGRPIRAAEIRSAAKTVVLKSTADNAAPTTSTRAYSAGPGIGHNQNVRARPMTIGAYPQDKSPSPTQKVHGQAAEQRSHRKGAAHPRSPGTNSRRSLCAVEGGVDQRQRAGHQKRAPSPWTSAG